MIFSENSQEKYNKERFYGAYIHDLRRYYEISQQELAKVIHVSNSALSKMESGQQNMDLNTFDHAIQYFEKHDPDYHFNRNFSKIEESEQQVDRCLQEFIDLSFFDSLNEIKCYLDKEENKHSFAYFHYRIIELFYKLFHDQGTMKEAQEILEANYFLDEYYLAILYDLYGIIENFTEQGKIQHQINSLKKAYSYTQQINDPAFIGLVEYHLSYHYEDAFDLMNALDMIQNAEQNLQRSGSYRRLITVQMNEANLYMNLKIYSRANSIYTYLLSKRGQIHNDLLETSLFDNLSWCEFLQGKDQQAIEYALKGKEMGSTFPDIYIVLAFSNYRLGQFDLACQFAQEFMNQDRADQRSGFIRLFMKLLLQVLKDESDILYLEEQILSLLPAFRAVELEIPFYTLLADHYKKHQDLVKALEIQDRLIHYLEHDFNQH